MIASLSGKIINLSPANLVIDCSGVGYLVNICLSTYTQLEGKEEITLFIKMIVREDAMLLYGFTEISEKNFFELLIQVNGVGPTSAMVILSTMEINTLQNAILNGDSKTIQSVKGIGSKTAQRIIIDLKDKIDINQDTISLKPTLQNKTKIDALVALEVLGLSKVNAEKVVDSLLKENTYDSVERLVKDALKKHS